MAGAAPPLANQGGHKQKTAARRPFGTPGKPTLPRAGKPETRSVNADGPAPKR